LHTLGVDAICIDQANEIECNQQVSIMGDIYTCASHVANWLSPSTSHTALGMEILPFIFGEKDIIASPPWEKRVASHIRNGLNDILKREYFERAWVIQEDALASKVTMQAKNEKVTCHKGATTHRAICRIKFAVISPSWEAAGLQDVDFRPLLEILDQSIMISRRKMNKPCRDVTVLDTVYDLRRRKATDDRDRLFTWRSLLPEEMQKYIVVDYSKSVEEIYGQLFQEVKRTYMEEMKFVELSEQERLRKTEESKRYRGGGGW
jgi:hypothetical protein